MDIKNLNVNDLASWPKKKKAAVAAIAFCILFIIAFFALIYPQYSSLHNEKQQELELKQKLVLVMPQVLDLKQQADQLGKIKKLINDQSQALPKPEKLEAVLAELNQLATKNNLDLLFLKPQNIQPDKIYANIPIAISATGDYFQIANFINQIAHLNYYLFIGQMSITLDALKKNIPTNKKPIQTQQQDQLKMDLMIHMYYYAPLPKEEQKDKKGAKKAPAKAGKAPAKEQKNAH